MLHVSIYADFTYGSSSFAASDKEVDQFPLILTALSHVA